MDGNLLVYLQPKSINGNWLRNNRCEMEDMRDCIRTLGVASQEISTSGWMVVVRK